MTTARRCAGAKDIWTEREGSATVQHFETPVAWVEMKTNVHREDLRWGPEGFGSAPGKSPSSRPPASWVVYSIFNVRS
jgi:hypothetical protein